MSYGLPRESPPFQQVLIHRMQIVIEYHRSARYLDAIDEFCRIEDEVHEEGVHVSDMEFSREFCATAQALRPIFEDIRTKEADLLGLRRFSSIAQRIGLLLDACHQQTQNRRSAALAALESAAEEDFRIRSLTREEEAEG